MSYDVKSKLTNTNRKDKDISDVSILLPDFPNFISKAI